ncbi:unnamed protein product [Protopolystoma xenopodis]|uniref:Uncharacterized protein n=1 Tax=Protopolystoma xenopodis TaxID=117903 RepID=A0A3S5ACW6_9PLAT|nr:unnamed protein product [Protopolystoma xenopodis]
MARLTDDADYDARKCMGIYHVNGPTGNYHAYYGLRTRYVPLGLPANMTKLRKRGQTTSIDSPCDYCELNQLYSFGGVVSVEPVLRSNDLHRFRLWEGSAITCLTELAWRQVWRLYVVKLQRRINSQTHLLMRDNTSKATILKCATSGAHAFTYPSETINPPSTYTSADSSVSATRDVSDPKWSYPQFQVSRLSLLYIILNDL